MFFRRWRAVAKVGDVAAGAVIPVMLGRHELVLGLDGDRYFATQRACAHRGGDLSFGMISRGELVCPLHGWRFSTTDGAVAGDPEHCLAVHAVRVNGDAIEVESRATRRAGPKPSSR